MAKRHRRAFDARWLLLGICLAGAPVAAEEIYRWTDANGNVHFGNRKPAGQQAETTQGGLVNQTGSEPAPAAKPANKSRTEDRAARLMRLQRESRQSERRSSGSGPVILSGAPKTLEEQRARQEERRDNERARYNRARQEYP